jgi:sec-independent protein translocase protein TatA
VFTHWWEFGIILLLALVFFGPKRLPEIGQSMGKGIREFRKATTEPDEKIDAPPATDTATQIPPAAPRDEAS